MPTESQQARVKRTAKIIAVLKKEFPDADTRLKYDRSNALQSLVATILSAQCTDDRVNIVTVELFKKYRTVKDFAEVSQEELEADVRTCGFYRNKAKNIRAAAAMILKNFGGKVPDTMEELLSLPGVARKTANCVLSNAYGRNEGVVVDTHVIRLGARLGLTKHTNPVKIEQDLMKLVPQNQWGLFSHLMMFHGRAYCVARKPKCEQCPLDGSKKLCPSYNKA
ncbi:MAG: endonuclease III [Phycisphaerae bacterium]|nr:endonuclease III [Phycisphaerae bacterium]